MKYVSDYIVPIGKEGLKIVNTGSWRTRKPVLDQTKCVRCGACLMYCPVNSVRRIDGQFVINYDYCKGCGICAHECRKNAIEKVPVEEGE